MVEIHGRDYHSTPIRSKQDPKLVAWILYYDNSNIGTAHCAMCKERLHDNQNLVEARYEVSEFEDFCFGIFCKDCLNRIFKF